MQTPRNRRRGSFTLMALCFTTVIGIALASYIAICYRSLQLSTRTVQSTRAFNLAEIGLEEGLWALNENTWTSWSISGSNATRTFTGYSLGQGATGQVAVTITNYSGNTPQIAAAAIVTLSDGSTVPKTLTATTTTAPLFSNAVATTAGTVNFRTGGTVDSYNSTLGVYGGTNVGFAAVVAGPSVTFTNATIKGYVATSGNSVSWSSSGQLLGPSSSGTNVVEPTRIGQSAFTPLFTVAEPPGYTDSYTGTGAPLGNPVAGAATEYWYCWGDLDLAGGTTLRVHGPVVLIVTDDLHIYDTSRILITGNGRLELFVRDDVIITGTGSIQNDTLDPKKCALYATGTSRTFTYSSTTATPYYGVIYSEDDATMDFTTSPIIHGAILGRSSIDFGTGTSPVIHYDMALRNLAKGWFKGVSTPFLINQITES
jgi:hypothetical protein